MGLKPAKNITPKDLATKLNLSERYEKELRKKKIEKEIQENFKIIMDDNFSLLDIDDSNKD